MTQLNTEIRSTIVNWHDLAFVTGWGVRFRSWFRAHSACRHPPVWLARWSPLLCGSCRGLSGPGRQAGYYICFGHCWAGEAGQTHTYACQSPLRFSALHIFQCWALLAQQLRSSLTAICSCCGTPALLHMLFHMFVHEWSLGVENTKTLLNHRVWRANKSTCEGLCPPLG